MPLSSSAPDPAADDLIDNRYRLIEAVARGGSATVWRARDERLSRAVAVKILDDGRSGDRTWQEARTLAQLSQPHVPAVFDYGSHNDRDYIVLELVDGVSLARVLSERELPWQAAVAVCAQIALALAAAHARGLVHRDVTPANIMLSSGGIKLIDFGISSISGDREVDADGGLRGTPMYAAPERLTADAVQAPCDVYSLGVILYRLLSRRMPWQTSNPAAIVAAQPSTGPDPLPPVDGLPAEVAELCMRCLVRDPQARPSSAEVAELLQQAAPANALNMFVAEALADTEPTQIIGHPTRTAQPRRRAARAVAVAAVATLIWIAVWWAIDSTSDDPPPAHQAIAAAPAAATPSCSVTYQLVSDDGKAFTAQLTIATQAALPTGWQLALHLPTGHAAHVSVERGWQQTNGALIGPPQRGLAEGERGQLRLAGRHLTANPLPDTATVGDRSCTLLLLGPKASPTKRPPTVVTGGGRAGNGNEGRSGGQGNGSNEGSQGQDHDTGRPTDAGSVARRRSSAQSRANR